MFNFWEQFILSTVLGVLSALRRNPAQVPALKNVLVHILDDLCIVLGVTPPVVP